MTNLSASEANPGPPDVLFVCVHNSGRSVAAKLIFNDMATRQGSELRAESAGTDPGRQVNPMVASVLESMGLDSTNETPKRLQDSMLANDPVVVTMGCAVDANLCPAINLQDAQDWGLPDPASLPADRVAPVILEIKARVRQLIRALTI